MERAAAGGKYEEGSIAVDLIRCEQDELVAESYQQADDKIRCEQDELVAESLQQVLLMR